MNLIPGRGDAVNAYTALSLPLTGRLHCGLWPCRVAITAAGHSTVLLVLTGVDTHIATRHLDAGYSNQSLPLHLTGPLRCLVCPQRQVVVEEGSTSALQIQEATDRHNREHHTVRSVTAVARPGPCAAVTALDIRRLQRRFTR